MKIPLPKNYTYKDIAYEKDGILYIKQLYSFHSMMFDVTYKTTENFECKYCGIKLTRDSSTLDHVCPVFLGGPYLPCNLSICCRRCNGLKDSMLEEDFKYYQELSKKAQLRYKADYRKKLSKLLNETPVIPSEWFSYENIESISLDHISRANKSLSKPRTLYNRYKRIRTPIIVDKNHTLLDGYYSYIIAKENDVTIVPVIVLENVVLEKNKEICK